MKELISFVQTLISENSEQVTAEMVERLKKEELKKQEAAKPNRKITDEEPKSFDSTDQKHVFQAVEEELQKTIVDVMTKPKATEKVAQETTPLADVEPVLSRTTLKGVECLVYLQAKEGLHQAVSDMVKYSCSFPFEETENCRMLWENHKGSEEELAMKALVELKITFEDTAALILEFEC